MAVRLPYVREHGERAWREILKGGPDKKETFLESLGRIRKNVCKA